MASSLFSTKPINEYRGRPADKDHPESLSRKETGMAMGASNIWVYPIENPSWDQQFSHSLWEAKCKYILS